MSNTLACPKLDGIGGVSPSDELIKRSNFADGGEQSAIILSATVSQRGGCRQNSQLLRRFQDKAIDLGSG